MFPDFLKEHLGTLTQQHNITTRKTWILKMMCFTHTGDLHHGVYVIRVPETVPKAHQEKCEEVTTPGLEKMVHADPVGLEVRKH